MGRSPFGHVLLACLALALLPSGAAAAAASSGEANLKKHHHHHKGHRHRHHKAEGEKHAEVAKHVQLKASEQANATEAVNATKAVRELVNSTTKAPEIPATTKAPESAKSHSKPDTDKSVLQVNAPLPPDFSELFAKSVAAATGCEASSVRVLSSREKDGEDKLAEIQFEAPKEAVKAVMKQAADAESKLATGPLCRFLVARVDGSDIADQCKSEPEGKSAEVAEDDADEGPPTPPTPPKTAGVDATGGIDVDTAMPYGDLEPFGREDTAQELTESSIKESNAMVDQLERAEVAEEKRAVFRALTRLRGAAITSFDGIARSQTSVIDEYNKLHQWRNAHPLRHLANEESDISKWAFPDANL